MEEIFFLALKDDMGGKLVLENDKDVCLGKELVE